MTKLVVIVGFIVAFAAGLMVGIATQQPSSASSSSTPPTTRSSNRRGWMASELNLTPQQQEQLDKIWSETSRDRMHQGEDHRRQLRTERDDGILALIPADKRPDYDQVMNKYKEQNAELDREMRKNFDEAVRRTKEILNPDQRVKYDEWLSHHRPGDRGRDRSSQPSTNP